MLSYIAVVGLTLLPSLQAQEGSEYLDGFNALKREDFRSQFRVHGELVVLDKDGKKFIAPTSEQRDWRLSSNASNQIEDSWVVTAKNFKKFSLLHTWIIHPDNSIEVVIQQCDTLKKNKCTKVLKEARHFVVNFEAQNWVIETTASQRLVARFTPIVDDVRRRAASDPIVIGGDRDSFEVFDNQGSIWWANARFGGVFNGFKTTRGSVMFSLYPFTGGREMGFATGKIIELNPADKLRLTIRNDRDIVPGEARLKIYGKYLPNLKAADVETAYTFGHEVAATIPSEFR